MNVDLYFTQKRLTMDQLPKYLSKTPKLLKHMRTSLWTYVGNGFLDMTPKDWETKEKIDKWDFLQI